MTPNQSHGHVTPNANGSRARCGGPTICKVCMAELAQLQAKAAPAGPDEKILWYTGNTAEPTGAVEVEIPDIAATFDGLYLVPMQPLKRGDHLISLAQHLRIMAAKDGDAVKLDGLIRANQQMGRIYLHFKTTEQHHAALRELRALLGGAG